MTLDEVVKLHPVIDAVLNLRDDERRAANVLLLHRGGRYIADNAQQDGYREMANKCVALESDLAAAIKRAQEADNRARSGDEAWGAIVKELRAENEKLRGALEDLQDIIEGK